MWQKLNVTSFLVSGVTALNAGAIGLPYVDGSGNEYAPMLGQPVMVFAANAEEVRRAFERATERDVPTAIYTYELFATGNDIDNRAAVASVERDALDLAGFAFRTQRKTADKVLKGLKLHS